LPPSEIAGSGGAPTEGKQGGESRANGVFERGRGKHSPPANLERVTAKALKRGDKGSSSPDTRDITIMTSGNHNSGIHFASLIT